MEERKKCFLYAIYILLICIAFSVLILMLCRPLPIEKNTILLESAESIRIVIDPGHGGRDGGAVSKDGIKEKELNLAVALCLNDILNLCGAETVMTRTTDTLVCDENDPALKGRIKVTDLKNRLVIARENESSVFVSIHMNKFPQEKYNGLQVYYSPNNEFSFEIAKTIQDRICKDLQPGNTRKIKKAGSSIFLLDRIKSPAILIECGFLSNPSEVIKLNDQSYRAQLALLFADSLLSNREEM